MNVRSVLCLVAISHSISSYGQTTIGFGTVSGTVLDYTGSGIPDTTVILSNEKMAVQRTMETTDEGVFNATALPPGTGYDIKVSRKGFLDIEYKNFEVLLGHTFHFKVSLAQEPALARGEVEKASIEMVDVTDAPQFTLSESEVDALPGRDRDVTSLAPLSTAVTPVTATGELAFHS